MIEYYIDLKIYSSVIKYINNLVEKLNNDNLGDMGPTGYITLINTMKKENLAGYDCDKLELRLKELVNNSI